MFSNNENSKKLSRTLGYQFKDEKILLKALTRRSAINEGLQDSKIGDFQRLEFIGDKVLNLIISDILFENNPTWNEGELTLEASKFVNNKGPLAQVAQNIELGKYLIIGSGEELNGARQNTKVLSDAFEAVIGAIWTDSENNYSLVKKFIKKQFKTLGLIDFNEEYEKMVVKFGAKALGAELMEQIMPEIYEAEGEERFGVGLSELLAFHQIKNKVTKPLSGTAAFFERYLNHSDESQSESDESQFDYPDSESKEETISSKTTSDSLLWLAPSSLASSKSGSPENKEILKDKSQEDKEAVFIHKTKKNLDSKFNQK